MNDSQKIRCAKEELRQRLEHAKTVFPELKDLSDADGKNAVKRYFRDRFGEEPIDQGDVLYFRELKLRFDAEERLLEMASNAGPARAVRDHFWPYPLVQADGAGMTGTNLNQPIVRHRV